MVVQRSGRDSNLEEVSEDAATHQSSTPSSNEAAAPHRSSIPQADSAAPKTRGFEALPIRNRSYEEALQVVEPGGLGPPFMVVLELPRFSGQGE